MVKADATVADKNLLASVLIDPSIIRDFNLASWDLLVRQGRRAGVLGRIAFILEQENLLGCVPVQALKHIKSAEVAGRQFKQTLKWEIRCIQAALIASGKRFVFLKGAAYMLAGDMAANGRMFADVDILVAKEFLSECEALLRQHGWARNNISSYDQKYYTEWMHELPPMHNVFRGTALDLHHNILPITTRLCPDANLLLDNSVEITENDVFVLAQEDRVLHSAVHLFHESDFTHGFRDISDLDLLIRELQHEERFWEKLLNRADILNQQIPLFYALRYTHQILKTPFSYDVENMASPIKSRLVLATMDFMFLRALMPDHSSCTDIWTGLARWLLYVRSHWLKMPLYLLIPHLSRKAWMRLTGKDQH